MNWLKRKIVSWLREDWYNSQPVADSSPVAVGANAIDINGLSFNIMSATGGAVVQVRYYDRKTDRSGYHTHVIPDGEDIAERIGQIVSMELLRA
jgi:hypothetical protein